MKVLVIIKSPPASQVVHEIATNTIGQLCSNIDVEISGIFFTDSSVSLSSKGICQISSLCNLQENYLKISKNMSIPLFVCGRAFMEQGLAKENICDGFVLSGNMELSMLICSTDKILEF